MKIALTFNWYTDGDWKVDIEEIKREIADMTEIARIHFDNEYEEDCGIGGVSFLIDDEILGASREAFNIASCVASILLCAVRILWTHYYVLEDIYCLFERLREFFQETRQRIKNNKEYSTEFYDLISGNYDGTSVEVVIQK